MKLKLYFFIIILSGVVNQLSAQLSNPFNPDYIKELMNKNVEYFQNDVFSKDSINPRLISWNGATYYVGLLEAWKYTNDENYHNQLTNVCNNFQWRLFPNHQNATANNLLMGDIYLNMYLLNNNPDYISGLQKEIDRMMNSEWKGGDYWWWVDALFVGPPTFACLAQVTRDEACLDFMHKKWKLTYNDLYDKQEHLFYRDSNWVYNPEDSKTYTSTSGKIFWSRGNGWAVGGICRLLNYLPEDHPYRKFYIKILKETLKSITAYQQQDGLWTSNLVDQKDFPDTETSGSALFCYAMTWGINNGILNRKKYEPVIRKTWTALVNCIQPEGYLGYCQIEAHSPGIVKKTDTDWFGQGFFLLAATEVLKLVDIQEKTKCKQK